MKLALYQLATALGGPVIYAYLKHRLKKGKEDPVRFSERLGIATNPRPKAKLMWMHAASVGEALSVLPVIERLKTDAPEWTVMVTTGTLTSAAVMAERLPRGAFHQFVPVDRMVYVRRFLDHWKPDMAVWMESEFWPNLVLETHARDIPMMLLNGRLSDRSYSRWRKNPAMIKRLLAAFQLILAQSALDGERFGALGALNVTVPGNLKYAATPLPATAVELNQLKSEIGDRPTWLAASTHPGEETLCGRVHMALDLPQLLTVIVPRHPQRGTSIAVELTDLGLNVARRSLNQPITPNTQVYIADTLGELGLFFRACSTVFMGKSLGKSITRQGGQNPLEPAQLHCAVLFGPHMDNFKDTAKALVSTGGAVQVNDEFELKDALALLLTDVTTHAKTADAALAVAVSQVQVIDRVMSKILPALNKNTSGDDHART